MCRSNGFAGSIAGAVLEAPPEETKIETTEIPDSVPMMFVVSAKSQEALLQYLNNYLDFCLDVDDSLFHSSATDTDFSRPTCRPRCSN